MPIPLYYQLPNLMHTLTATLHLLRSMLRRGQYLAHRLRQGVCTYRTAATSITGWMYSIGHSPLRNVCRGREHENSEVLTQISVF
jgi:hypothetical protein